MSLDPIELVLVKLRDRAGRRDRERIERTLLGWGARLHVSQDWGWIVQLHQSHKALLRNDRAVAVVGGVQPTVRKTPRIRAEASAIEPADAKPPQPIITSHHQ